MKRPVYDADADNRVDVAEKIYDGTNSATASAVSAAVAHISSVGASHSGLAPLSTIPAASATSAAVAHISADGFSHSAVSQAMVYGSAAYQHISAGGFSHSAVSQAMVLGSASVSAVHVHNPFLLSSTSTTTAIALSTIPTVYANASDGAFDAVLPAASSVAGRVFWIKKTDAQANNVTVSGAIDGAGAYVLSQQYMGVTIHAANSAWNRL
jgi:hypothetical protein